MALIPRSLNGGIFLAETQYEMPLHLDKAHLLRLEAGKDLGTTDLGLLTPWINTGYMDTPGMYELTNLGKNKVSLPNGKWTWQVSVAEEDNVVVEDMSTTDRPGVDGQTFKVKFKKRFGNTQIISADKFSGVALYVTADPIEGVGDGFIHTVRLHSTNAKRKWFPKEYLKIGTTFFVLSSVMGEYSQTYNDMGGSFSLGGKQEFYMSIANSGTANVTFSVTRDAAFSEISSKCVAGLDEYKQILSMYVFRPGSKGYDISLSGQQPKEKVQSLMKAYGNDMKNIRRDVVATSWIPKLEQLAMMHVEKDVETYAMWGPGGQLDVQGFASTTLQPGLFHQLMAGELYTYNISNFSLDKLEVMLINRLKDRIKMYGQNEIVVGTGRGGMQLIRRALNKLPREHNMMIMADERWLKNPSGNNYELLFEGPSFTAYRFEFGVVKFTVLPSLDPVNANDLENPYVNSFRLSSYLFIVDDITGQRDNIFEMVMGDRPDFHHRFINGKMPYMNSDAYKAFQSSSHHPGFEVYIEKYHKAYWVSDVTKTLMLRPINPRTGRPFAEIYFE